MRGIKKHDPAQRSRSAGREDLPAETMLIQERQKARVVNMGMGQKHHVDVTYRDRNRFVLIKIRALLHTAVNQELLPAGIQVITASGHFMRCTQKC